MQPPVTPPKFPMPIPPAPITTPPVSPNQTPGTGHGASHAYGYDAVPELEQARADILAEVTRAKNAESGLQTNINTEATARAMADTGLGNRIAVFENRETLVELSAGQQLTPSNTTPQVITGMKLTMIALGVYRIAFTAFYNCTGTAHIKMGFTAPIGANVQIRAGQYTDAAGITQFGAVLGSGGTLNALGDGAVHAVEFFGTVLCGATPGDLQFVASQNVSTAENTDFVSSGTNGYFTRMA